MQRRSFCRTGAALALASTGLGAARADGYPTGPISVVLPLQAGSASDVAVRLMTDRLGPLVGAPMAVENVTGAAGLIGLERVARARPDGQSLAALNNSIVTILPHLQPGMVKIDTRTAFEPIAGIANIPTFFGVKRGSPFKSVRELVAYARANPEKLTYASGGRGSPQHMATEMFMAYTGVRLLHVPYKGASQAALALASGEVDVMTIALSLALPFTPEGRVELIAYCGPRRHPQFAELPTLQEQGVKDYDYSSWIGLFAPKGTPAPVLALLRRHATASAADRNMQSQLIRSGLEPWERNGAQLQRAVEQDYARWAEVVKVGNIKAT